MENGDDDLMELKESKSKFDNLINYKEEFWNSIHEISPGNKFKFEKCFDNLNYININDSKNFDALIKIFKQIEKDISDYNHVSSVNNINITDYFRKKLDELKNKYRAKYFYKLAEISIKEGLK